MKFLKNWYHLFFILLIWSIFAAPYLVKNKTTFSSTYQVNHFPPWSSYEKYWGPVKNGAMPDIVDQIYPWRHFSITEIKNGRIPLWNPNNFSGNPNLANFQSAVFSPVNILFLFLPFINAWTLAVLLQPLLAGISAALFARSIKISKRGSIVSGVSFMFCGFITVWMAYGTLSLAIAFLPLVLFGIEQAFSQKNKISYLLIAVILPLSFFSGHFQTSFYLLLFSLIFFIFKLLSGRDFKTGFKVLLSMAAGLFISFPQLLPSIELYSHTIRSEIFINRTWGIPIQYLITIVTPDFFGNPVTRNDWFGYYAEWASFAGVIPLSLAFVSVSLIKKNKNILFFSITSLVFLVLSLNSPLLDLIGLSRIPVLSTSNPGRIIVLFSLSIAILGGFGFDFIQCSSKKDIRRIIFSLLPILMILILTWVSLFAFRFLPADKLLIAKRNLLLPSAFFLLVFAAPILLTVKIIKRYVGLVLFLLIIFIAFDSLRYVTKWMPYDSSSLVYQNLPVIDSMQKSVDHGRVFGNLGGQVETMYGVPSIQGYDPLYIASYGEFIQYSTDAKYVLPERSVVKLNKFGKYTDRTLDILGVNLIFNPVADTNQSWAYHVWDKTDRYSKIYSDGKFELYKNNSVVPRGSLFFDFIVKNKKDVLSTFYSDNFDYKKTLVLEKDPGLRPFKNSYGTSKIIEENPEKIVVKTESNSPSFLFLADNYYPGWKVSVDGVRKEILRANYSFRAVALPAGFHLITFSYDPISFKLGLTFAGAGILLLGYLLLLRK